MVTVTLFPISTELAEGLALAEAAFTTPPSIPTNKNIMIVMINDFFIVFPPS